MARRLAGSSPVQAGLALALILLWLNPALLAGAQTPTPEPPTYVVQPGDTLFAIAQRFGTTVEELVALNQLADADSLEVGQVLRLPSGSMPSPPEEEAPAYTRVHPIRQGETLPGLALRYGMTLWDLAAANDLDSLWPLVPGTELAIPPPRVVTALTPRFPTLKVEPVVQGQTLLVELRDTGSLEVQGWLAGDPLQFAFEGGRYWALMGIEPLATPQAYPLLIEAIELSAEGQPGDRLTLRREVQVLPGEYSSQTIYIPADRRGLLRLNSLGMNASWSRPSLPGEPYRQWGGAFGYPWTASCASRRDSATADPTTVVPLPATTLASTWARPPVRRSTHRPPAPSPWPRSSRCGATPSFSTTAGGSLPRSGTSARSTSRLGTR